MAILRIPPFVTTAATGHLRSPSAARGGDRSVTIHPVRINCNLKEKKRNRDASSPIPPPLPSPLQRAEELASSLGLEMAVAGLERLFREASGGGRDPPGLAGDPGRPVRVAYQGVRGSYCQEAAARAFPSPLFVSEAFPCSNMEDAFAALEDRSADRAVVPAENSIDGPIGRNLDLLLRHESVHIVGELVLPVNHCLLCHSDVERSVLRRVVSHPQALAHCEARLRDLDLEVEEVASAADAARYVAENRISDTAVIGSRIAGREFGLRVLEQNLQGPGGNFTRFLQIGMEPTADGGGARKTTVAFSLEKGVSDLFRAIGSFQNHGVRVTRVDHRPNRSRPVRVAGEVAYMDYAFVVDVDGSESDANVEAALARLRDIAGFVRVLGSYTCTCEARE